MHGTSGFRKANLFLCCCCFFAFAIWILELFRLLNVSVVFYLPKQSHYRWELPSYIQDTECFIKWQTWHCLALIRSDLTTGKPSPELDRFFFPLFFLFCFVLQTGGIYCTLMLSIKSLTHTLMLSEWEASALQEEFVPWHKERCDFQSAHIHLTHRDSRPWSRVMSSTNPLPTRPPGLQQAYVPTWLEYAPFKQRITPPRYRQGTEGESTNQEKQAMILESISAFSRSWDESVRYFNKKVPGVDSSAVLSVKCWASDVMALHTALPYDWTTQRRSQHSWLKCC